MNLRSMKVMEDYLKPTKFCDCDNQEIIDKAKELTKNDKTPKEMALSIFYFVRDQITFMMCGNDKASETLMKGHGDCSTKTNLQVALLRAVNIPARYHIASLRKECLKGIISKSLYKLFPDELSHHQWCECYLSEKWISCDTLFDKALTEAIYKKGIRTKEDIPTIDWDGEHDLNTMTKWMIQDKETLPSLDKLIIKAQREGEELPIENDQLEMIANQSNKYTDSMRKL
ncbi:MAG: transglutaminase domain-containing protein [Promethearchaeota archaeon]|nr:MAG: transglutaminase domain-containing protein [Candidatus Lokiarchaeota archaeon]